MTTQGELINRQARILDDRITSLTGFVAGAGMVGSWAALAMVKAGIDVHVWDDDTVEGVNVGVQAYDGKAIGLAKVDALAGLAVDPPIHPYMGRFPDDQRVRPGDEGIEILTENGTQRVEAANLVVVCGVDSMTGRREIAEWSRDNHVGLFIETGVHAELVVVKCITSEAGYRDYLAGLATDDQVEEPQCGLKGTAYAGMSLASQIVPLINGWCRGDRLPTTRLFHTGLFTVVTERWPEEGGVTAG
jgi:hypothetical protein